MSHVGRFYLTAVATVLACFGWPGFASMTHGQLTTPQLILDVACHVAGGLGLGLAHFLAAWSDGQQHALTGDPRPE